MYQHWQEVAFGKLHFSLDSWLTSGCVKQISISVFISSHFVKSTAKSYPVANGTNLRKFFLSPLQNPSSEVLKKPQFAPCSHKCPPFTLSEFWLGKAR